MIHIGYFYKINENLWVDVVNQGMLVNAPISSGRV